MNPVRLWGYLLVLSGLWGSSYPLVRYAVQSMPPLALSGVRAGMAAVGLGAFVLLARRAGPAGGASWRDMAVLGTINGWVPNVLIAIALGDVSSAQAALIAASGPLMVAVLGALVLHEDALTPRRMAGLLMGFGGVAVILAPVAASGGSVRGGLLMLLVALCYAGGTVYARWARPGPSLRLVMGQQVFASVPALLLGVLVHPLSAFAPPWPVWGAIVVLAVFASAVPMVLFLRLLRTAQASEAAMISYLQPVWATALAALLLSEWPEPRVLLGGAVVLGGVWLATARRTEHRNHGPG